MTDYAAVLTVMRRLDAKTVLEFGPGNSTLALIEGGATAIDACEDDPAWLATWAQRLPEDCPECVKVVTFHDYTWRCPLTIMGLDDKRYDLALIDGPAAIELRPAVIEYCLERCAAVLVPTEDYKEPPYLRGVVAMLAEKHGRTVEITETGPLSGAFALIT